MFSTMASHTLEGVLGKALELLCEGGAGCTVEAGEDSVRVGPGSCGVSLVQLNGPGNHSLRQGWWYGSMTGLVWDKEVLG